MVGTHDVSIPKIVASYEMKNWNEMYHLSFHVHLCFNLLTAFDRVRIEQSKSI